MYRERNEYTINEISECLDLTNRQKNKLHDLFDTRLLEKVIRIGMLEGHSIFAKIEYIDGRLSISGVHGPKRNGNAFGGCGQIDMEFKELDNRGYYSLDDITPAPQWTHEMIRKFFEVWKRWHLNDMRPGCEHQRNQDTSHEIPLQHYTWSDKFHKVRRDVEAGEATTGEYTAYKAIAPFVYETTIKMNAPKYESQLVKDLLADDWIKPDKIEYKTAGWTDAREHPQGLLNKPCEVCGYKYGSAWLKEEVPQDVIEFLESLPETDLTPAWV